MFASLRRRAGDEQGTTLVICSFVLIGLMTAAGLVVDFGLVRADRQQNKSAADLAVAAGMRSLEFGGYPAPFRGVCEAIKYLKVNHPQLTALTTTGKFKNGNNVAIASSDPCTTAAPEWKQLCTANKDTWAVYEDTIGGINVKIKNGYDLSDGGYADETLVSGDGGDPDLANCDHLAVEISETETPGFGKLAYAGNLTSRIRSVGRITQAIDVQAVIALLLLEREDCDALDFSGTNSAVQVKGYQTRPGIIHADSIGTGDDCSNQILNGVAASTGPPLNYTGPSILADRAESGTPIEPGHISVAAKSGIPGAIPGNAATSCPDTVVGVPSSGVWSSASPGPCVTGSSRKGRINVDILFRRRIVDLRAEAVTRTGWIPSPPGQRTVPASYAIYNCNPPASVPERYVFIDCSNFNNAVTFTHNDAEIVFGGEISGSRDMIFQNPAKIYVKGAISRQNGLFSVNAGSSADCTARGGVSGDRSKSTKLVVVNGRLSGSGGSINRLCQTTVLLADGNTSGSCPNVPAIPTTNGVHPYDNCFGGNVGLSGGGSFDWTAPNASDNPMQWDDPNDTVYLDDFEGLALWTEAQSGNALSGGGTNVMKGVFFLPNADPFTIDGGASQAIERDAQFIIRKLKMTGNGLLTMRPNPVDSVSFPYFSGFTMVR